MSRNSLLELIYELRGCEFESSCSLLSIYLFYKKPTVWSSEVNKVFLEQVKWQNRIIIICFNFLRNKDCVHKISSRNSALYKFHTKIYLESFVSIYHLYHLFGIIYKSIFYNFKHQIKLLVPQ